MLDFHLARGAEATILVTKVSCRTAVVLEMEAVVEESGRAVKNGGCVGQ